MPTLKLLFLSLIMVSSMPVTAQKILESSRKHKPEWVGETKEGFLIVSANANRLDKARSLCLEEVKEKMLEAVAQNVEITTETFMNQTVRSNSDIDLEERTSRSGRVTVANLPYIAGVTEAKVKDFYWEKFITSKGGEAEYCYTVMYPFRENDYQMLKRQFDNMEKTAAITMSRLEKAVSHVEHYDSIASAISQLETLAQYYFDSTRQNKARTLAARYAALYEHTAINSRKESGCRFTCWLSINGRKLQGIPIPKSKAECASQVKCSIVGDTLSVTYNNDYCVADEDNSIELTFTLNGHKIKHLLHF